MQQGDKFRVRKTGGIKISGWQYPKCFREGDVWQLTKGPGHLNFIRVFTNSETETAFKVLDYGVAICLEGLFNGVLEQSFDEEQAVCLQSCQTA
jgi:hypothetical protein